MHSALDASRGCDRVMVMCSKGVGGVIGFLLGFIGDYW